MCQKKTTCKMTVRSASSKCTNMESSSQQHERKRAREDGGEEEEEGDGQHPDDKLSHNKLAQMLQHYQNKVRDCKRIITRLKRQKDSELQVLTSQLLLLEGHLKREQNDIQSQMAQRDHFIQAQSQEIDRLRRDNRRLINKLKKFSDILDAKESEPKERKVKFSKLEADIDTAKSHSVSKICDASSDINCTDNINNIPVSRLPSSINATQISPSNCSSKQNNGNSTIENDSHNSVSPPQQPLVAVNTNVKSVRATPTRVLHKPPIAEKPKVTARISKMAVKPVSVTPVQGNRRTCTIVSTISRLLDEESDGSTATTTGSNSETSSPEATLKSMTPRVIRFVRQFEEGLTQQSEESLHCSERLTTSNVAALHSQHGSPPCDSSLESQRHQDYQFKSYVSDEHEVTSGYNSDAASEHDYENICIGGRRVTEDGQSVGTRDSTSTISEAQYLDQEEQEDGYVVFSDTNQDLDDDNYVVFRELKRNELDQENIDDQEIYSNVEFAPGVLVRPLSREEESTSEMENDSPRSRFLRQDSRSLSSLSSNSSCSPSDSLLSENVRSIRNVPRSRHNINIIFENDGDHMTDNFEEFTLDSLEFDEDHNSNVESRENSPREDSRGKENFPVPEPRRRGDGAEAKLRDSPKKISCESSNDDKNLQEVVYLNANGQYEKFLEVTGLSQKSIVTPLRMLINHRSVVKPRDIKHRNKLRTAFSTLSTLEEAPTQEYRYWSGPYI